MSFAQRLRATYETFHPTFWVANGMELFERLAYYGQQIVFMIYLRNNLGFSEAQAGTLSGIFGGLIYLMPILAGTLADKWGFRRAFNLAFTILALGYFAIGTMGMGAFSGIYGGTVPYPLLVAFLVLTAFLTFSVSNFYENNQADLRSVFVWHPWVYLILVPAAAMRLCRHSNEIYFDYRWLPETTSTFGAEMVQAYANAAVALDNAAAPPTVVGVAPAGGTVVV